MGVWVFPIAHLLLCLTSESLQGGLPRLPPNLGKGYSPSSGLGTAFGDAKPQKPGFSNTQPGSPAQNGYGTGVGGVMEPPKPVFSNTNGLEAGACPDIASYPGFGGVVKPEKPGYGPGLAAGVFAGTGTQPAPAPQNGHGPGIRGAMKPPKPGYGNGNGIRVGAFPGVGAQPGLGAGTKTQKPGFGNGNSLGAQPGLGNRNGLNARAFPGTGAQPGLGEGLKPQKPGPAPQNGYGPGFGKGNGLGLGAQPGPPAQNGHGAAIRVGMKPPKSGFGNGNGIGPAAQSGFGNGNGLGTQSGFGGSRKPQKPGYGNGNGLDALPGVGRKSQKPGPAAQNGYRQDYGTDTKPQKSGFWNGHGHGVQLGYRNGLGTRAFQGKGPQPGYMPENRLGVFTGLGGAMKPPKTVYSNGHGMAAQPGPCHGGVAPPQLLPRSPTPAVPSDKGGSWGLKSQLLPPVQTGKFPAPTPAIQWGLKPQKAGYQAFNGYGAEAEPGFPGLKLQKVGFHYGNGALEAGISPEILQSGYPIANSFRNGFREETLLYPKTTVPTLQRNGQPEALQGSPWPALQPWGAGMKPGYGYAGCGNQAGPYGHPRPELGLKHFGGPEVKADTKSQLGNRYRGHCPSGKC